MSNGISDRMIENILAEAIEETKPDMLGSLMEELGIPEEETAAEKAYTPVKAASGNGRKLFRSIAGTAAALVIAVGLMMVYGNLSSTFAVIDLDVNPGIELSISKNEKVIEAKAVNDEGQDILEGMDLKGTNINTACNAVTGAMLTRGYLSPTSNSILVSVHHVKDVEKGVEIEKALSERLNAYLVNSDISPAVLGQYVEESDELKAFADANGITEGKAWMIKNLLASGSAKMTEESLLKLSTQELLVLCQERNVSSGSKYGSVDTSSYIGADKAVETALADAGTDRSSASGIKAEYDTENGVIVYEVEFTSGGREYEYDIDAVSGKIMTSDNGEDDKYDRDTDDDRDDADDDRDDRDDDDRYDRDDDDSDNDADDDRCPLLVVEIVHGK